MKTMHLTTLSRFSTPTLPTASVRRKNSVLHGPRAARRQRLFSREELHVLRNGKARRPPGGTSRQEAMRFAYFKQPAGQAGLAEGAPVPLIGKEFVAVRSISTDHHYA